MADQVPGQLHISNDVLADMAGYAALQCYGVIGMATPSASDGIAKLLPASRLRRGVVVARDDEGVSVDMYVIVEYGTNITAISKNLQDAVEFAITQYAQLAVSRIDVHVQGVKVRK